MIQRVQTLWLLLAAVCAFLGFRVSFYFGTLKGTQVNTPLYATASMLLIICAAATGLGAFISIFLYKNRKLQMRITLLSLILSILTLVLYVAETGKYDTGSYTLTSVITFVIPVFLILAARGIWKD